MTGEVWHDKPPLRLILYKATSDDEVWQCEHYTGCGVMKLHESDAAFARVMGESIEARLQASLKTAQDHNGGVPRVS